jgi:hypothetical protein
MSTRRAQVIVLLSFLALGGCGASTKLQPPAGSSAGADGATPTGAGGARTDGGAGGDGTGAVGAAGVGAASDAGDMPDGPVEASTCVGIDSGDPGLFLSGTGNYEGPAVVTSSFASSLTLSLTGAAADAAPAEGVIQGHLAPALPVGAKVWLNAVFKPGVPRAPAPWTFTVSDKENGTILFGAESRAPNDATGPVIAGATFPICTGSSTCFVRTLYALEVTGADSNPIPSGASATVPIGATSYQVWVEASSWSTSPMGCGEEPAQDLPIRLTFEAKNLTALAAGLAR